MPNQLHITQPTVKEPVARCPNDFPANPCQALRMAQRSAIHRAKTPIRKHFIAERAGARGRSEAEKNRIRATLEAAFPRTGTEG